MAIDMMVEITLLVVLVVVAHEEQVVLEELLIKVLQVVVLTHLVDKNQEVEVEVLQQLEQMVHHQEVEMVEMV